jgi:hypothetical protein
MKAKPCLLYNIECLQGNSWVKVQCWSQLEEDDIIRMWDRKTGDLVQNRSGGVVFVVRKIDVGMDLEDAPAEVEKIVKIEKVQL